MVQTKKGYKNTEVGVIPEDWDLKSLNLISKITRLAGYEYSTVWQETQNGEIIALRGFNIGENKIIEKDIVRISDKLSMKLIRSRLFKGDVIYPCVGTNGNAVVIEENDKYHIQQNIAKISPSTSDLDSKFLAYYLMSSFGYAEIKRFNGSSSQPNILVSSLRKYRVILPPLPEQQAIATVLSDTDNLIQTLSKQIAKKRLIKQGAMQKLLTPTEGWEVKKLGEIGEGIIGLTYSPNDVSSYGTLVLRSSNIQNSQLAFKNNVFVNMKLPNRAIVKENDILICVRNGSKRLIGKCALVDKKSEGSAFGAFMTIYRSEYGRYIFHVFRSDFIQKQIDEVMGATINQITNKDLSSFDVPFAPIKEQTRIATILSDMDIEIETLEKKLSKYKQFKQGLMQNLLTGKIRLT